MSNLSNLIINEIDYSKFDLEWAEHGGWCIVRGEVCKLISKATYISSDTDTLFVRAVAERMATPEECRKAGVKYIEPPARWSSIGDFPPPEYTWVGDEEDKPSEIREDDWENYEIRGNRAIICTANGFVTEAYEWFGEWVHLDKDSGYYCFVEGTPTHYMPLPQPPKEN